MVVPSHNAWLKGLDLEKEGIVTALIDATVFEQSVIAEDLASSKDMLINYAGERNLRNRV